MTFLAITCSTCKQMCIAKSGHGVLKELNGLWSKRLKNQMSLRHVCVMPTICSLEQHVSTLASVRPRWKTRVLVFDQMHVVDIAMPNLVEIPGSV